MPTEPPRPSAFPRWATEAVVDDIVDPGASLKALGWQPSQKPPAQFFNWIQNNAGEWLFHLLGLQTRNWAQRDPPPSVGSTRYRGVTVNRNTGRVCVVGFDDTGAVPRISASKFGQFFLEGTPVAGGGIAMTRVTFGNGRFLAAKVGGDFEFSADGITWTNSVDTGLDTNRSLDYKLVTGESILVVAVGVGGATQRSVTGDSGSWIAGSVGAATAMHCVRHNQRAASAGLWVAVGDGGEIYTSPDAITWTARTSGTAVALRAVVYDAQHSFWVATGAAVSIRSADGITWVASTDSVTEITALASDGKGTVVGVGSSETSNIEEVVASYDGGDTWHVVTVGYGIRYWDVTYNALSGFVIVGEDYSANALILQSIY